MSSASDYQQSDTSERSGFVVDAVSDDVGKGVFATRDFLAGETIFRERPLVSAQVRQKDSASGLWIQLPFRTVSATSLCYFFYGSILYSFCAPQ